MLPPIKARDPDSFQATIIGHESGNLYRVKRDGWQEGQFIIVPVVPPYAFPPWPCRCRVFLEDASNHRPFIYWPDSRSRLEEARPGLVDVGIWRRLGAQFPLMNQTEEETTLLPLGTRAAGSAEFSAHCVRSWPDGDGFVLGSFFGSDFRTLTYTPAAPPDPASEIVATVSVTGEISSLWVDGSDPWILVQSVDEGGGDYGAGFADGEAAAAINTDSGGLNPFQHGEAWFALFPEDYDSRANFPDPAPDPPAGSTEYQDGWVAGFSQGWDDQFLLGWLSAGGDLP